MKLFRELSENEASEFRAWARANYKPLTAISGAWHPIVQEECAAINREKGADISVAALLGSELQPYYTVVIPFVDEGATEWHPTERFGPFSTLTRGAFASESEAHDWARRLNGTPYTVRLVTGDA